MMIKFFRKLFPSKEFRAYKKMRNKHRKELIKLAKVDYDFDWAYLHDLVITKIRHMYEYYKAGNHVWQTNESLLPIIEQLKHVLDLDYEVEHLYDNIPIAEKIKNENGSITFIYTDEISAARDRAYERAEELYQEIYTYIGKYLREWWD